MGSRFREQLTHWTDAAVFTQPDQWKGFLSAMGTAHEADLLYMRNFLERTDAERPQARHFREQREEQVVLPPVVRRVLIMCRTDWPRFGKDAGIWLHRCKSGTRTSSSPQAQQDYRLGAERVIDFDKHNYLAMKRLQRVSLARLWTPPRQQEKLGTDSPTGFTEGMCKGATAIASQLQELKRPTQIAESFHLLNVIRKLVREFARQSPKEPVPSAIVKAAFQRVVPETYRRAMETQVDVDKVEPHNLEDKVVALIRNNTSGAAPMDIGNSAPGQTPAPGLGSSSQSTTSSSHGGSDSYPDLNNYEHASQWGQDWNAGDANTSGSSDGELYGLQKGKGAKGKGSSNGICCTVCRKVKELRAKGVSMASATTVESQVIRPSSVTQRVEKQKERDRERRETAKVGMRAKVGQSERDGQTVKVGTLQEKVGSNKCQHDIAQAQRKWPQRWSLHWTNKLLLHLESKTQARTRKLQTEQSFRSMAQRT